MTRVYVYGLLIVVAVILAGLIYLDTRRDAAWSAEEASLTAMVHQRQQERHAASVALINAKRHQDSVDASTRVAAMAAARARAKVTVMSSTRLAVQRDSDGTTELVTVPPEVTGALLAQDLQLAGMRNQLAARDSVNVKASVLIRSDSAVIGAQADDITHLRTKPRTATWEKVALGAAAVWVLKEVVVTVLGGH